MPFAFRTKVRLQNYILGSCRASVCVYTVLRINFKPSFAFLDFQITFTESEIIGVYWSILLEVWFGDFPFSTRFSSGRHYLCISGISGFKCEQLVFCRELCRISGFLLLNRRPHDIGNSFRNVKNLAANKLCRFSSDVLLLLVASCRLVFFRSMCKVKHCGQQ